MEEKLILEIGQSRLNLINAVRLICPNARLCGSISLIYYGVIDRKIGDIDFVVSEKEIKSLKPFILEDVSESDGEEGDESFNESFKCKIGDSTFCLFVADDTNSIVADFKVFNIKVDHPKFAVDAKRKYVVAAIKKKNEHTAYYKKHTADIQAYEKWMGDFI